MVLCLKPVTISITYLFEIMIYDETPSEYVYQILTGDRAH